MNQGVKTIIYPVKDLEGAKALYRTLLGVEPYVEQSYYVGFRLADQEIGLDPNGHQAGATTYFHVEDIKQSLQALINLGAQVEQEIRDVGGGRLIAILKDADGNIFGLLQA